MIQSREAFFEEVYHLHKDKVYRLCRGFMPRPQEADDLFQEVMIKIWNHLDKFRQESQISTWIYRITTNAALLALNRRKNQQQKLEEAKPSILESSLPVEATEQEAKVQKLRQFISELKEQDRFVMTLLLEGCSYQEISDITGLSMSNVGVKINRLKKQIKQKFVAYER